MSFEDWFYEQEGFGLRAERFFEDECERDMQLFINMKKWLEAAYEAGQEKEADEWYEKALWGDKLKEKKRSREEFLEDLYAWANKPYKWVGLTDDEIGEIKQTSPIYVSAKAVNAIVPMVEAKLKEKNT